MLILLVILSEVSPAGYPIHDTATGVLIAVAAFLAWRMALDTHVVRVVGAIGVVSFPFFLYHRPIVTKVANLWCRRSTRLLCRH
jgi:peptidoglycan/LPS O-acetylase OafA/YrhL